MSLVDVAYPTITTIEEWKKNTMGLAAEAIVTYGSEEAVLRMTLYAAALLRTLRDWGCQVTLPDMATLGAPFNNQEDKEAFRMIISQQLLKALQTQVHQLQASNELTEAKKA
jgi:hypothetical protein